MASVLERDRVRTESQKQQRGGRLFNWLDVCLGWVRSVGFLFRELVRGAHREGAVHYSPSSAALAGYASLQLFQLVRHEIVFEAMKLCVRVAVLERCGCPCNVRLNGRLNVDVILIDHNSNKYIEHSKLVWPSASFFVRGVAPVECVGTKDKRGGIIWEHLGILKNGEFTPNENWKVNVCCFQQDHFLVLTRYIHKNASGQPCLRFLIK